MIGLLEGVRVVQAAVLLVGDYTGMLLAGEGADVVKVEAHPTGDWIRDHMGAVAPRLLDVRASFCILASEMTNPRSSSAATSSNSHVIPGSCVSGVALPCWTRLSCTRREP